MAFADALDWSCWAAICAACASFWACWACCLAAVKPANSNSTVLHSSELFAMHANDLVSLASSMEAWALANDTRAAARSAAAEMASALAVARLAAADAAAAASALASLSRAAFLASRSVTDSVPVTEAMNFLRTSADTTTVVDVFTPPLGRMTSYLRAVFAAP